MAKPDWISVDPADGEGGRQTMVIVRRNYLANVREGTVTVKTASGITKQVTVDQRGVTPWCDIQNNTFDVKDSHKVNVLFRGSGMVQFKGTGELLESGTATVYASTKEPTGGGFFGFLDPNDDSWVECVRSGRTTWTIPDGAFYLKVAFTAHEYMGAVQAMNITVYRSGSIPLYNGTTTVNIHPLLQFNALTPSYSVSMNPFSDAIFKFNIKSDLVTLRFPESTYEISFTSIAYNEDSNPSASGSLWTECLGDILGSGLTLNWRDKQYFNLKFNGRYHSTGSSVTLILQATDANGGEVEVQTQTITFNKAY